MSREGAIEVREELTAEGVARYQPGVCRLPQHGVLRRIQGPELPLRPRAARR